VNEACLDDYGCLLVVRDLWLYDRAPVERVAR
jgi:hypothetical protein